MIDRNRKTISAFARYANLDVLIRLSGEGVIFPFYHTVSDEPLHHIRHLYPLKTLSEFETDLDDMLKHFEPVSLSDHIKNLDQGSRKRCMILTFDDGLAGCHEIIAPLLKKKGVPATFFLNNNFIDNRGLFYRYKASLLIDRIELDGRVKEKVADFLAIPEEHVVETIQMINYNQVPLLDALSKEVQVDFTEYIKQHPVYLSTTQVKDLVNWGFEIGGHSPEHADFSSLDQEEMTRQVQDSVEDLQKRFGITTRFFSFPFTSSGVPENVIDKLLNDRVAEALLGTAGLKKYSKPGFMQRIPMEEYGHNAKQALKTEFLYFLIKGPLGRNRLRF